MASGYGAEAVMYIPMVTGPARVVTGYGYREVGNIPGAVIFGTGGTGEDNKKQDRVWQLTIPDLVLGIERIMHDPEPICLFCFSSQ